MVAICSKCGYKYESFILDKAEAMKEIMEKSNRHIKQKHEEIFAEASRAISVCMVGLITAAHFNEFMFVPEDEEYLKEQIQDCTSKVMFALGFDETGDEEEEEEDETEESEDSEELEEQPIIEDIKPEVNTEV